LENEVDQLRKSLDEKNESCNEALEKIEVYESKEVNLQLLGFLALDHCPAMTDEFDKGFFLFTMLISPNMAKLPLSFLLPEDQYSIG
jgi:hypothetical protein